MTKNANRKIIARNGLRYRHKTAQPFFDGAGVDDPMLWATAGCTPDETRTQMALSEDNLNRMPVKALRTLASLQNSTT